MLYIIWIAAIITLTLAWILKGYIFNAFCLLNMVIDRVKSFYCRLRDRFLNAVDPTFPLQQREESTDVEAYEEFWRD